MFDDPIVEEVHRARHELLNRFGGDIHAYTEALAKKEYPGFRMANLEPVKPFAWNGGVRPEPLTKLAA